MKLSKHFSTFSSFSFSGGGGGAQSLDSDGGYFLFSGFFPELIVLTALRSFFLYSSGGC